jgi:hypothetical protein
VRFELDEIEAVIEKWVRETRGAHFRVKGTVLEVNARGMVAIELETFEFTVGEIPPGSDALESMDIVSGQFMDAGGQTIRNETKQRDVRLMIHAPRADGRAVNLLMLLGPG